MADQSLRSPIKRHFFQPLLPGFHTHLNIPVAFFSKHMEGRNEQNKTAKLRSDASDKTWLVKIDGLKLTDGWEDFSVAHDLRIGDIVLFRHEGGMVFHVTPLGPSCCEIQYASSLPSHNNIIVTENRSREKGVKKNPREKGESSSSDHSYFVARVSASSLTNDRLYLPLDFARSNGLNKMSSKNILLLNEEGRSWKLDLKHDKSGKQTFIRPGFRRFYAANGMSRGQYTFKLVRKSGPPAIRLCRAEHIPESEFSSNNSCLEGSATLSSLNNDKLYLPRRFVNANGLDKGCSEIVLKNGCGERWTLALKHYESLDLTLLKRGWTSFCRVNGIKVRDSFMFKLTGTGKKPVLSLCPAGSNRDKTPLECPEDSDDVDSLSSNAGSGDDSNKSRESEEEITEDKSISQVCFKRKHSSSCRASSSYSQNRFVTLTLTLKAFKTYKLILPRGFTRLNGINNPGKITLLGRDGVKQVVDLLLDKRSRRMRFGKGWREFCEAQGVKIDESFVLELIWEEEASPVLKFCTKLSSV